MGIIIGLIILVALMIPLLAVVLDSPLMRRLAARREGPAPSDDATQALTDRVATLEDEVDDLGQSVQQLKDERRFFQQLLDKVEESKKLPPPP